ncbi:MAG: Gfo/Idh/MocA family protein [Candidatus Latescibacterota bacterium]
MRRLRWGLIGCGDIARKRVAPALRDTPDAEFVGVSRARAELAEAFAREYDARKWYGTAEELIADPEIEAVYIATPVDLHAGQTIAAARAGKHVLCEKPMALSPEDCDRMIAACRETGVKLGIAYYRHFYPVIARTKDLLASGEIGIPAFAQINAFEYYNPSPDDPRYWFMKKERSGGGPMFDFGCHRIETLLNLLGSVREVKSMLGNTAFVREMEDTASALFRFESGAQGCLTVTHASFLAQDTLDIFGTEGALRVPNLNSGIITVRTRSGERTETLPPHPNFHYPLVGDFTGAVRENREPGVGGDAGRAVNLILERIYSAGN